MPRGSPLVSRGLSPRVRGKRLARWRRNDPPRSIPACAGEADTSRRKRNIGKVYPRVCGGSKPTEPDYA